MLRRFSRFLRTLPHREPDQQRQHGESGHECAREEPQCPVKNRLTVELNPDGERSAVEAIGEMLFPGEDVAGLHVGRLIRVQIARIVPEDSAGQVQPEGNDCGSIPSDVLQRAALQCGWADLLLEDVVALLYLE